LRRPRRASIRTQILVLAILLVVLVSVVAATMEPLIYGRHDKGLEIGLPAGGSRAWSISGAGSGTLKLHLTLTGARTPTPALGPFSRFDMAGGVYNGVEAARGREGSMFGSANYAVEIHDAADGHLLRSYVTRQYPNAMNVGADFSPLAASRVGIEKGADMLVAELR
jgi:hypothetical protein